MGKTETTKKTTASKGAAKVPGRATRASKRATRREEERAAKERAWHRQLHKVMQTTEEKAMIRKNAWNDLQAAERAMNALKKVFKKEEMAWAKACIKRGQLLFEREPDWEAKKQCWDSNWEFACFAKGYDKEEEAIDSDNKIIGDTDAWLEWKAIAAWEGWLMMEQRGMAEEQEHLASMERAAEEAGNWDWII